MSFQSKPSCFSTLVLLKYRKGPRISIHTRSDMVHKHNKRASWWQLPSVFSSKASPHLLLGIYWLQYDILKFTSSTNAPTQRQTFWYRTQCFPMNGSGCSIRKEEQKIFLCHFIKADRMGETEKPMLISWGNLKRRSPSSRTSRSWLYWLFWRESGTNLRSLMNMLWGTFLHITGFGPGWRNTEDRRKWNCCGRRRVNGSLTLA